MAAGDRQSTPPDLRMTKRKRMVHCHYSPDFRLYEDEEECVHALLALSLATSIHGEEWSRPEKEKSPSQTAAPTREQGLTLLLTPEVEKQMQNQRLPRPSTRKQEASSILPPVLVQRDQERLPSPQALAQQSHLLPPPPPERELPSLLAPSSTQQSQTPQAPPPEQRQTLLSSPPQPPDQELPSLLAPSLTMQCQTPPPPEKRLTLLSSPSPPPEQELPSLLAPWLTQQSQTPMPPPQPPEQRLILLSSPPPSPSPPRCYKCSECGKTFSSYQAVGGHMTSHRKRPSAKQAGTTTTPPSASVTRGGQEGIERPHECPVCHKSFPTGQSLGGHMRCHYKGKRQTTSRSAVATPSSSPTECSTTKGLAIDLNQPATLEVDWSKEEAGVRSRPPVAALQPPRLFGFV